MGTDNSTSFLLQTVTALVGAKGSREFADMLNRELAKAITFDVAGLFLYNEAAEALTPVSNFLVDPAHQGYQVGQLPASGTIKHAAVEAGKALLCDDLIASAWTEGRILSQSRAVASCVVTPLVIEAESGAAGRAIAVVFAAAYARAAFTEQDRLFMEMLARHLAPVLRTVLAAEERDALRAINSRLVLGTVTMESLIPAIKDILQQVIPHDLTCLVRFTREGGTQWFELLHVDGATVDMESLRQFPFDRMAPAEMLRTGRPVLISGHRREAFSELTYFESIGILSGMLCPLIVDGRPYGFLAIGSRRRNAFSEHDLGLAEQVSLHLSQAISNILAYEETKALKDQLEHENLSLREEVSRPLDLKELVGTSGALQKTLKAIEQAAPTDSTILITGETGTGKELIAKAIHELSPRRGKPLIKVNCAALPPGLIESELFGHEKGAFTNAVARKIGRFELANGGTIVLDEVGEIPLDIQVKLLRVLESRELERVGGSRTIVLNVRVLAATNANLEDAVQSGSFRPDIYYRLKVFPIHVPPLRERREDIAALARHFAKKYALQHRKPLSRISADTMKALTRYDWPGNVRELEHMVERAVILARGPVLRIDELVDSSAFAATSGSTIADRTLAEAERDHILQVLTKTQWVLAGRQGAAARLGMKRSTLQHRMKKLGIRKASG